MAGSNVVYLPFPSAPPVTLEGERGLHPGRLPRSGTALLADCGIDKELASDLLSAPPLDLRALASGGRGWPWSVG